jgi:hypothetical protein
MGFLTKQLRWGLLLGLGLPIFMLGIASLKLDFDLEEVDLFTGIATLCALPNLLLFFGSLRKNNEPFAYGVLASSILWALLTFGLKFFG